MIRITPEVRELLGKLAETFQRFDQQTERLCDRVNPASDQEAIEVGANREHTRNEILGLAYRLNKAAQGTKKGQ